MSKGITIKIKLSADEVEEIFGPECTYHNPGCSCCRAWESFYKGKHSTVVVPKKFRNEIVSYLKGE